MSIDEFHPILLKAGIAYHNGDWNWKNVRSPFFRIYYVADGNAQIEIEGQVYQLHKDNIYVVPPFALHSTSCSERFVHYYIHLYDSEETNLFNEYQIPVCIRSNEDTMQLFQRIVTQNPDLSLADSNPHSYDNKEGLQESLLHNRQRSFPVQLETRSIIYLIILELLHHSTLKNEQCDARIRKVLEHIPSHLAEDFSSTSLADMACLSPEHFIRIFKKSVNYTPMQYVNIKRMERAQLLLATSDMQIERIATVVGYHDLSYFVKSFKKFTGLCPSRYREEIKKQR